MKMPWMLVLLLLPSAGAAAQDKADATLRYEVFTASAAGLHATATLVYGEKEAVLIDTPFLLSDASKLAVAIKARNRKLTVVYVTSPNPARYFGMAALREVFPDAKLVSFKPVVTAIRETWKVKLAECKPIYKNDLPDAPVLPEVISGGQDGMISIDGEPVIQPFGAMQGASRICTYAWIPSLKLVSAGDIAFEGVHPWTGETDAAARERWLLSLKDIERLGPKTVVSGHQSADASTRPASLTFMREYLVSFDRERADARSAEGLRQAMLEKYPGLSMPELLQKSAEAAFRAR